MADWAKIKAEYITTEISYRKLAQKYGLRYGTIQARAKEEGWIEARNRYRIELESKIIDSISDQQVSDAQLLHSTARKLLENINKVLEHRNALRIDTQEYKHMSSILKDIKDIQMIRSEADLREQEARIANLQRQAAKDADTDDVTIALEGEVAAYGE